MTTAIAAIEPKFAAGEPLTVEDWLNQPEDWPRNELFQGMIVLTPAPDFAHQAWGGEIYSALLAYARTHGGYAMVAPFAVRLASDIGFEPDVIYVSPARLGLLTERALTGAPDLVVEVAAPSTRAYDTGAKLPIYLTHGVREVWIVDPVARTVAVYFAESPAEALVVRFGEEIPSRVVPGVGAAGLDQMPPLPE